MASKAKSKASSKTAKPKVALGQLPRGRHKLSREEVAQSQRLRMMLAIADAMSEKGYVGTSVADVLKRAGVSRETFYEQFSSKLDCFMSAFEAASDLLLTRIEQTIHDVNGSPMERFDRAFTAYLDTLVDNPALARVFLVEVYAAGPEALDLRQSRQERIVDWICDVFDARTKRDRFACEMLVAAVGAKVTGPVMANDTDALRTLRVDVLQLVKRFVSALP